MFLGLFFGSQFQTALIDFAPVETTGVDQKTEQVALFGTFGELYDVAAILVGSDCEHVRHNVIVVLDDVLFPYVMVGGLVVAVCLDAVGRNLDPAVLEVEVLCRGGALTEVEIITLT